MSERKVQQKYYPPDFDPSRLRRSRRPQTAPRLPTVRLMAPFSWRCTACGCYASKGTKFNARKGTTTEKYCSRPIYRFYVRCSQCASQIVFATDPRNVGYAMVSGAKRGFEPWRRGESRGGADRERLHRLEDERDEMRDSMQRMESRVVGTRREMQIADALNEIWIRNARHERIAAGPITLDTSHVTAEIEKQDEKDSEAWKAAREAFPNKACEPGYGGGSEGLLDIPTSAMAFKKGIYRKRDLAAILGIKRKRSTIE